jgi:sugar phosphate isomerase/epimerase
MTVKLSFSTLACPDWTMQQTISIASAAAYDGIELRFIENQDSLWKLPAFRGNGLTVTKRALSDHGLAICCVDTSCRFHSPDANERARWGEEGERMAELAADLGAPGIRVFGDTIQTGADRASTRMWIAESVQQLADSIAATGVEVWLETHGDFAGASETLAILAEADAAGIGVVWDPANCFLEFKEPPGKGAAILGASIRHMHIKDVLQNQNGWTPVLTGEGNFPLSEVRAALCQIDYNAFVSFEWEKKWHQEIPDASIALSHFARWFRENWVS